MKNEKCTVFPFPFFYENEKRMKTLKIQSKNLLSMKMVANPWVKRDIRFLL